MVVFIIQDENSLFWLTKAIKQNYLSQIPFRKELYFKNQTLYFSTFHPLAYKKPPTPSSPILRRISADYLVHIIK